MATQRSTAVIVYFAHLLGHVLRSFRDLRLSSNVCTTDRCGEAYQADQRLHAFHDCSALLHGARNLCGGGCCLQSDNDRTNAALGLQQFVLQTTDQNQAVTFAVAHFGFLCLDQRLCKCFDGCCLIFLRSFLHFRFDLELISLDFCATRADGFSVNSGSFS
mgnify:CR=1 FL=1